MFSQRNKRFNKRSKKKARRSTERSRSRKLMAAFEPLEARQLLTVATVPWVANHTFNQFVGEGGPTAIGLGIVGDGIDQTTDEPGFIGFEIVPEKKRPTL